MPIITKGGRELLQKHPVLKQLLCSRELIEERRRQLEGLLGEPTLIALEVGLVSDRQTLAAAVGEVGDALLLELPEVARLGFSLVSLGLIVGFALALTETAQELLATEDKL